MQVKMVKIAKLKLATYNPQGRTRGKGILALKRSIADIGLMYPILVDKDNNVVDGHRRIAAMKELGLDEVPTLMTSGENAKDTVYSQINATAMKMTGHQNITVFLKNKNAVTASARNRYQRVIERFGLPVLRQIANAGMSMNVVKTAQRVANFLDIEDDSEIRDIIRWLILHRNSRSVHAYIETGQSGRALLMSIKAKKPLRTVFRAG
jgi:hypothetical protein